MDSRLVFRRPEDPRSEPEYWQSTARDISDVFLTVAELGWRAESPGDGRIADPDDASVEHRRRDPAAPAHGSAGTGSDRFVHHLTGSAIPPDGQGHIADSDRHAVGTGQLLEIDGDVATGGHWVD